MKIVHSFEEIKSIKENIVCALGTFDGLHKGHQRVLSQMVECAKKTEAKSMVITFNHHPLSILEPNKKVPLLMEEKQRIQIFKDMGVDYIFLITVSKEFLNLTPKEFVEELLKTNIKDIYVGTNFTFGRHGAGNVNLLSTLASLGKVKVHALDLKRIDYTNNNPISSTLIRKAVENGKMELVKHMLGRPFSFTSTVLYGEQRGRTLGFPTINFILDNHLACPKDGVYVNRVKVGNTWYNGVSNVGNNPTFQDQIHRIEVHIFNFNSNIYGEEVDVEFLHFLRPEVKFNSLDALIKQIEEDVRQAHLYLKEHKYE